MLRWIYILSPWLIISLPFVVVLVYGLVELWSWPLLLAISVCEFLGIMVFHLLKKRIQQSVIPEFPALPDVWNPEQEDAYTTIVQPLVEQGRAGEIRLKVDEMTAICRKLLLDIALHYHPSSKQPLFSVTPMHLARAIEETARDVSEQLMKIPGSHEITIDGIMRTAHSVQIIGQLKDYGDFIYMLLNPFRILTRVKSELLYKDLKKNIFNWFECWLTGLILQRLGVHAIELYSGRLTVLRLHDTSYLPGTFTGEISAGGASDGTPQLPLDPVKILVLGQTGSGKSSLINALRQTFEAPTNVLPTTVRVTIYQFSFEGWEGSPLILMDTAGYEQADSPADFASLALEQAGDTDLILLVTAATNPARKPDADIVRMVRSFYDKHTELKMPPIICVVTFIDQLRPLREWAPPYNFTKPISPKEQAVSAACTYIQEHLSEDVIVTVPICTEPAKYYNISEGLLPLLAVTLQNEAKRVQLLRLYDRHLKKENLLIFKKQVKELGNVAFMRARKLLGNTEDLLVLVDKLLNRSKEV